MSMETLNVASDIGPTRGAIAPERGRLSEEDGHVTRLQLTRARETPSTWAMLQKVMRRSSGARPVCWTLQPTR